MAAETLRPDAQLSCSGLSSCVVTEHDQDPDTNSTTITATGNNTNTEYGVDFSTPSGNPTVGADLQVFRAGVIEFDSGQTGTPQARIELWENGVLVRAGTNTNVSVYAVLAFTWDASELATADGSLVQCKVIGVKTGGSPSARNTINIGHIEWNAEVNAGGPVTGEGSSAGTSTVSGVPTVSGSSVGIATVTAEGISTAKADGSSVGIATTTGDGISTAVADGSATGVAVTTAVGQEAGNVVTGDGSSAGISTVTGDGISTFAAPGSSAGIATGNATPTVSGSSVGVATVNAIPSVIGSSIGVAIVSGIPKVFGISSGNASVAGDGVSLFRGLGFSIGIATVTGDGVATVAADGTITNAATVSGEGISTFASLGSSIGAATVTGEATAQNTTTTGTAAGIATVEAVGYETTVWDEHRLMIEDIERTLIPEYIPERTEYRSRR